MTCTFVNQRPGTITITKEAEPEDPQDFSFVAGGGLSPSSFQLDDDGTPNPLSNSLTFSNLEPAAGYSVAEAVPPGWEQQSATCSDGSSVSNIDVAPDEHVQCTFANRKLTGLIVTLDTQPNDPQDFDFTAGGGLSPGAFQLDDDGDDTNTLSSTRTFANVPAGSYSLGVAPVPGWHQPSVTCSDGSPASNITLSAGETTTCAFTIQRKGRITVVQDTSPDGPQDFGYTTGGLSPASFQLDDDGNDSNGLAHTRVFDDLVPAGAPYSMSQDPVPGWLLDSSTCSDGSSPASIAVSPGEQITCTFVNSERGRIIVRKNARPNNPVDFSFTAGGGISPSSFQLDDDGDETNALASSRDFILTPGSGYSVAEGPPPNGWTLASADCSDGSPVSTIALAAGETVTCTFVNDGKIGNYPRPRGATPLHAQLVPAYRHVLRRTATMALRSRRLPVTRRSVPRAPSPSARLTPTVQPQTSWAG